MIIVTGTKRSGTSMWMQVLIAAGLPAFGEAFPGQWRERIGEANPEGFFESSLRFGIYYKTNPHPETGAYFFPEQVNRHVVKVFIPGLVRTDRAYIGRVVATVRPWREYVASLARLHAMEDGQRPEGAPPPVRMPAELEWWAENFMLIRDVATRRLPVHVQSYDGLLDDPGAVIPKVLEWLGLEGLDVDAAVAAVRPERRTQHGAALGDLPDLAVEAPMVDLWDELYAQIHAGRGLGSALVQRLNEANVTLTPRIAEAQRRVHEHAQARSRARRASAPG